MSNEGDGSTGESTSDAPLKPLRQIISKLNDWAALSTIALFILAAPIGRAIGDFGLSFIFALLFCLPLLLLRAYQIHHRNYLDAIKLDNERAIKLATIESNLKVKLARIAGKSSLAAPTPTKSPPPSTPAASPMSDPRGRGRSP